MRQNFLRVAGPKAAVVLLTSLLLALLAVGAGVSTGAESKEPITIEADSMISLDNKNTILFSGNVDANQGDVRILSDEMTVYYKNNSEQERREIDKLKCVGNVEMTRGDWRGTGRQMDYLAAKRKVIITGDAKAWQGENLVSGATMHYYLDEGRSEVFGDQPDTPEGQGNGRVKATIIPR
ncbi:MAG: lipopolysaccharide transport periplasmic protein LptA [Desulfobulbaceae bacterium]|uniref:Lipopolysaccharide transport periplasmic protein LptA n=1 Tax=Candidatus Desulfatifera sulfidica TaxID=2841691 RepID=A0A8J6TDC4_9BACT|nr:lipopolysaccharide transport periplasmic protein LptA [Candidatus Desulfatifera sulfidica]